MTNTYCYLIEKTNPSISLAKKLKQKQTKNKTHKHNKAKLNLLLHNYFYKNLLWTFTFDLITFYLIHFNKM